MCRPLYQHNQMAAETPQQHTSVRDVYAELHSRDLLAAAIELMAGLDANNVARDRVGFSLHDAYLTDTKSSKSEHQLSA
jgi:hypothetical protein